MELFEVLILFRIRSVYSNDISKSSHNGKIFKSFSIDDHISKQCSFTIIFMMISVIDHLQAANIPAILSFVRESSINDYSKDVVLVIRGEVNILDTRIRIGLGLMNG